MKDYEKDYENHHCANCGAPCGGIRDGWAGNDGNMRPFKVKWRDELRQQVPLCEKCFKAEMAARAEADAEARRPHLVPPTE